MSPELEASPYSRSELWQARDLVFRKAIAAATEAWNDTLTRNAPTLPAILQLQSAAAGLQAAAAELQFMRGQR